MKSPHGTYHRMLYIVNDATKAQIKGYYLTQIKGQTLDILWVFSSVEKFYHHKFLDTVHSGNPATWWLHHTVGFSFFTTTTFEDLVYWQTSSHWQRLRVSSYRGFFLFFKVTTIHTNLNRSTPFRQPPLAQSLILTVNGLGLIPQDIPTGQNLYLQSKDWYKIQMSTKFMGCDSHNGTQPPQTPSRCSWFFLFYHDKQTNTHGYYIRGFIFFPTIT